MSGPVGCMSSPRCVRAFPVLLYLTILVVAVPLSAQGGQGPVTLASAPSGTTTETNPEIQVVAPGKVSYRYSLNGAPYSQELPISTPIALTGQVGVGYGQFTPGTRALAEFLRLRNTDDAFIHIPFFDRVSFDHLESQLQVTYAINGKRTAVEPENILNIRGATIADLEVSLQEKVPTGPHFELSALALSGGELSKQASPDETKRFLLSLPHTAGTITLTAHTNNEETLIEVNGQTVVSGQSVSIAAPAEGSSIEVFTTGPAGVVTSYAVEIHYDDALETSVYRSFYLRASAPASAYVRVRNVGAEVVTYGLTFNQKFGVTQEGLIREIEAMMPEYAAEPIQSKVWRFIRANRYHFWPFTRANWNKTPALFFNSVGFGFCDDTAALFYHLMTAMGYTARVWQLNGLHTVPEVFVNGRWEMWDADLEVYYENRDGLVAGVEELHADPELITEPLNPLPSATGNGAYGVSGYAAQVANIYAGPNYSVDLGPTWLPPMNISSVTLAIPPGGVFEFPDVYDAPLPALFLEQVPSYSNARLIVPAGFSGTLGMPLVVQSVGWSNNPRLSVITKDAEGNWDAQPTVTAWIVDAEPPFTTATQSGVYDTQELVTLTASEHATIYYTTDGSTPTEASAVYSAPLAMGPAGVVKFFGVDLVGNREQVKFYGPPVQNVQLQISDVTDTTATFSATASGGSGTYEFMFRLFDPHNGLEDPWNGWSVVQFYGPANTWTWTKPAGAAGWYNVEVWVRNVGTTVAQDGSAVTQLVIIPGTAPILTNPGDQVDDDSVRAYSDAVLSSMPVGYWRMGETVGPSAADSMRANPGMLVGGVTLGQPSALVDTNAAMQFDGSTGYIGVANPAGVSLAGDLTIEVWVNVSLATRQTLISKSYLHEFELTLETDGGLNLYQGNGTMYSNVWSVQGAVTANTWQHVVVTRTAATQTIRFYVNGTAKGSGTYALTPSLSTTAISLGRATWGGQYVNGRLDEIALYSAALSPTEVAKHFAMRAADGSGTRIALPLVASDPDGDVLTYSVNGLPPGLAVNAATGLISGTLTATSAGFHQVTATASDGSRSKSQSFTWTVTHVNLPPILAAPGNQSSVESTTISLQLAGSDSDGDSLTYSVNGLPPGLSVNAVSGLISGTLTAASAGIYAVTATVSAASESASQTFTWTVNHANRAPVLANPGTQIHTDRWDYAQTVQADGPMSYWRMGETVGPSATDSMGANPGTLVGSVTLGQQGALTGSNTAMLFDGSTSYIGVANPIGVSLAGDLTIELWVNVSLATRQTLISKHYLQEFELTLEKNGGLNFYQGNGSTYQNVWSAPGAVTANTWQHVAVTRTAATQTIVFYVNGVAKGSGTYALTPISSSTAVSIGRGAWGGQYVNGRLDEIALYRVVLSPTQLATHFAMRAADGSGTPIALPLSASDPDADVLTYGASGLPPGLAVHSSTGLISGTLTAASAGIYQVTATASDGSLSHSQSFTWTVTHDYAQTVQADGPASFWRLGETVGSSAADSVGASPGTLVGNVTMGQPGAIADGNAAMLFNGSTSYIGVANPSGVLLAGDLTIELWVNVPLSTRQTLISKHYLREFELTLETSGGLNLYQGNGATYQNVWSASGAVKPNTWQHVVVTRNAATQTIRFYVNGVAKGSGTYALVPMSSSTAISLGRGAWGGQYVNGRLDEIAVYTTALSPTQIARHWAMRAP